MEKKYTISAQIVGIAEAEDPEMAIISANGASSGPNPADILDGIDLELVIHKEQAKNYHLGQELSITISAS